MTRRGVAAALLAAALGLSLAACAGPAGPQSTLRSSLAPAASPAVPAPPDASASPAASAAVTSPVTGRITAIDSAGLAQVKGFTLRTSDGAQIPFAIGVLENGSQFPPGHLAEHMATASEVRVFFREDGGQLVVYRLEDADAPSP